MRYICGELRFIASRRGGSRHNISVTMATGNLILGTMSGKLGDIVAYTNNGKQCARVRRRVVRNPNSAGQQVQHMILSTAAQFVSALRPILNNGFEGIQKGAPSLAYARKLAMRMLRTEGMWNTPNGLSYNYKGSQYLSPNPFMVSKGSLYSPSVAFAGGSNGISLESAGISDTATLRQAFPWAEPGMQITLFGGEFIGTPTESTTLRSIVKIVSFVPKDDTTPLFVAVGSSGNFSINPAAVDAAYTQGDLSDVQFSPTGDFIFGSVIGEHAFGGVIYSTRDGSRRSTSYMVFDSTLVNTYAFNPDQVVDSYGASSVDSGAPAEYYLDQNPG